MQSRPFRLPTLPLPRWGAEALALLIVLITVAAIGPVRAGSLEQAMATVFTVHSADAEDRFLGSAFLWGDGQVAVTNAHVVRDATEVRLTDAQGGAEIGTVIARDPVRDVAVIAVTPGRAGLELGDAPALGAGVWALGAPLGIAFSVTTGHVSALHRQIEAAVPLRLLQHDAAVNPGSSGGPLVDAAGQLVGMNSQIADGSRMFIGVAYAISGADLSRIVTGLIDETLLPYPPLGLTGRAVDRQVAQALAVPVGGILVDTVDPDGLARSLRAGDLIVSVDSTRLTQPGDLAFAIESAQSRGTAGLLVLRAGQPVLIELSLPPPEPSMTLRELDGTAARRVTSYTLDALGIDIGDGNVVARISHNSPALGLAAGDVVLALNGVALDRAALQSAVIDRPALLLLRGADGRTRHVMVDPWSHPPGIRPVGGANVLDPAVVVF